MNCNFIYKLMGYQRFVLSNIIVVFIVLFNNSYNYAYNNPPYKIKTVVIDAGHGGKDPGCVSKRGYEKDIALSVSLKLGNYIKANYSDVKVVYTRSTDEFVELFKRAQIANDNNADLFICIHANATKNKDIFGAETFVMGLSKSNANLEVTKLENSAILHEDNYSKKYDGFDPNSPEGNIIFSLYQNAYLDQSINLADKIQHQFKNSVGRYNRGVKQAGFLVLWKTSMPSVLIELGFMSNEKESVFLFSKKGQDYLASAIFRAFRSYKNEIEGTKTTKYNDDTLLISKNDEATFDSIINVSLKEDSIKKFKDSLNNIYKSNKNNGDTKITYKVQFYTSPKSIPLNSKTFKGIKDIEETKEGNLYKYTTGKTTSYKEILAILNETKTKFKDAFPVAYKNGNKIIISDSMKSYGN